MNNVKRVLIPFHFFSSQLKELFEKGSKLEKALFFIYAIAFFILLLYSYTQIDLGLAITRISWIYAVEQKFQYIGYFNRPLSTIFFVSLVSFLSILYLFVCSFSEKKKIKEYTFWSIVGVGTILLAFSYNAFSYDLFNYIFDAKIVTHYFQNPYVREALNFPNDPMLGFMHWTNRTYPYGPAWLVMTIPVSFIGSNIFIITFYLFKLLISVCYVGTVYYIYNILQKISPVKTVSGSILFALNPLIIIEFLISSHNDIAMIFFATMAIYFFIEKRVSISLIMLIVSIAVKFATVFLFPAFLFQQFAVKEKMPYHRFFLLMFCFMMIPLFIVSQRSVFQPWYLIYIILFLPFLQNKWIKLIIITFSILSVFSYIPFLLYGNWNQIAYFDFVLVSYYTTGTLAVIGILYWIYYLLRSLIGISFA